MSSAAPPFDPTTTCHDCGNAPIWRHGGGSYCRRCHRKAGYATHIELDLDKLDKFLGPESADALVAACRSEDY